jgi:hypothetical protein
MRSVKPTPPKSSLFCGWREAGAVATGLGDSARQIRRDSSHDTGSSGGLHYHGELWSFSWACAVGMRSIKMEIRFQMLRNRGRIFLINSGGIVGVTSLLPDPHVMVMAESPNWSADSGEQASSSGALCPQMNRPAALSEFMSCHEAKCVIGPLLFVPLNTRTGVKTACIVSPRGEQYDDWRRAGFHGAEGARPRSLMLGAVSRPVLNFIATVARLPGGQRS